MRSFSHPPLRGFLLLRSPKSVSSFSPSLSIRPRLLLLKRDRSNPSFLKSFSLLASADLKFPPASLRSDLFPPSARTGMASVVGEGSVAARLWIASSKEALLGSYTPFVVLLAAGTLDMDTFRRYIAQDAYFLRAFAQAYEMAAECADDDDAKDALNELRKDALDELKMHDSVMQEFRSIRSRAEYVASEKDDTNSVRPRDEVPRKSMLADEKEARDVSEGREARAEDYSRRRPEDEFG